MAQVMASRVTRQTVGAIADGAFKVLLGTVCIAGAAPFGRLLGTPAWLMAVSGVALLIGGGIEIKYTRSRSMRTYTQLMIAYDSGWVLAALAGLLMAWRGSSAGGEVWMGYQTAAPIVFAALLVAAAPMQMASDTHAENTAR
ncbi:MULTISPECIES: hypothetical protein [unclassified Streptomyces]|uniref:hypothetical protein n=1 Tax=unclassified Streptomyces TaxID=2593676 RepID=UPI00225C28A6|nr:MULTISPECIES: hypothetical protein [unclassified Streptomyces]WSP53024.1 hypothetical protein OG306_00075 [Streptomyces sp. NBC_01241]WSU19619.1 hypothetical protein OG508_00015 [Streptomyces sp. NBC_01108]MCX4800031.1 hypothetical protein [Streptomyces sp. NBC_01242]WSP59827.1 hypothetical protein OG306_40075 [Streptomyces sp. NBC_01241]WSP60533.1 hypothetical protein OG466_00040 [Streptomyces sp. NBC_01240]